MTDIPIWLWVPLKLPSQSGWKGPKQSPFSFVSNLSGSITRNKWGFFQGLCGICFLITQTAEAEAISGSAFGSDGAISSQMRGLYSKPRHVVIIHPSEKAEEKFQGACSVQHITPDTLQNHTGNTSVVFERVSNLIFVYKLTIQQIRCLNPGRKLQILWSCSNSGCEVTFRSAARWDLISKKTKQALRQRLCKSIKKKNTTWEKCSRAETGAIGREERSSSLLS